MGPVHIEIILTEEGPKIVELGARMGGDSITSHLVPLATGVDFLKLHIEQSLGYNVKLESNIKYIQSAAINFLNSRSGKLIKIDYDEQLKSNKDIIDILIYPNEGEFINYTVDSSNRLGHVICIGNYPKEALDNCKTVSDKINVIVENCED